MLTALALAVLTDRSLKADLVRLTPAACRLMPDCSGASVAMLVDGQPSTVAVTDRVALQLDLVQYDNNNGPCVAALGGETIRIGFAPTDERFPHFAIGAADCRVLSVLSSPAIDHGTVAGSLNVFSHREEAFDQAEIDTVAVIRRDRQRLEQVIRARHGAGHTGSVAAAARRNHSGVAGSGVLIAIHDCSAGQAADLIRNAANDNSEAMITTAERILAIVEKDGTPDQPR